MTFAIMAFIAGLAALNHKFHDDFTKPYTITPLLVWLKINGKNARIVTRHITMITGIMIAIGWRLDVFAILAAEFGLVLESRLILGYELGEVLTGAAIGHGSNLIYNMWEIVSNLKKITRERIGEE